MREHAQRGNHRKLLDEVPFKMGLGWYGQDGRSLGVQRLPRRRGTLESSQPSLTDDLIQLCVFKDHLWADDSRISISILTFPLTPRLLCPTAWSTYRIPTRDLKLDMRNRGLSMPPHLSHPHLFFSIFPTSGPTFAGLLRGGESGLLPLLPLIPWRVSQQLLSVVPRDVSGS